MQLSTIELLAANYPPEDIDELVTVIQSTRLTSPSAVLRYGKILPSDLEAWLRQSCADDLRREFQVVRISSVEGQGELPLSHLGERLVVRDLDMICSRTSSGHLHQGRIVAYADWRFTPSYGTPREVAACEEDQPSRLISSPAGFNQNLHRHINERVESTMMQLFRGLPCFELHSISTLTPSHVRKGIAKRLTEWIFPYADQLGLPVILSASPVGFLLYKKCGFVEYQQYDVVIELDQWGGQGLHKLVTMVRWPLKKGCLLDVWKEWKSTHETLSETEIEAF